MKSTENVEYIDKEEAVELITDIVRHNAYELEDDEYMLIDETNITFGKEEDFTEEEMYYVIPVTDVVEFISDDEFIINKHPIENAIDDLF